MTSGERRLAERLEQKLDDNYLLWYDVLMGGATLKQKHCTNANYPSICTNAHATTTSALTPYKS